MKIIITEQQSKRLKRILSEESEYDMEEIIYDIKTSDCEGSRFGNMASMGVDEDEDGNIVATIRYCEGDDETLEHLKMKARMEIASNYGLDNIEDDDQTSEYTSYGKPSKYDPQYSQDPRERYDHGGSQPGH